MAHVHLPSPLRSLSGSAEIEVPGETVLEVLRRLEQELPRLAGWVLDERGELRPHVAVFVDGERALSGSRVEPNAQVHVVPAISGGSS
jgi:sulfur-carrier protein